MPIGLPRWRGLPQALPRAGDAIAAAVARLRLGPAMPKGADLAMMVAGLIAMTTATDRYAEGALSRVGCRTRDGELAEPVARVTADAMPGDAAVARSGGAAHGCQRKP